jgi:hypothetical protein
MSANPLPGQPGSLWKTAYVVAGQRGEAGEGKVIFCILHSEMLQISTSMTPDQAETLAAQLMQMAATIRSGIVLASPGMPHSDGGRS